ncbi:HpcH/HpaI aldolase/citrate lyase family protein [Nostocoides jenkinsii]|uniref:Citrate lyase subunit beta-like protein n=1 Tax=Nostocoides jenkinsii Ben 74 TaxID=1193518 RepID=A0A077ME48_9MICO|nr:CoA ester lyase [Tetrasphaera jenkinsii]CCI53138.1 Citrate lyase subunit beta-like protein [Tetrasphaera jenkinsii Ben 74]
MTSALTVGPAWLFCPADHPERYAKALERSDLVLLDLEDAVAPSAKAAAREAVRHLDLDWSRTIVRINAADTDEHAADLALVTEIGCPRVMLAKAETPESVGRMPVEVVVLVESPLGVVRARELVAEANVIGAMWGAEDLIAAMGGTSSRFADGSYRDVARHSRSEVLLAAKAMRRLAIDSVVLDIADAEGLAGECSDAVAVGFDAKAAIHPSQVSVIRDAFRTAPDEVAWARAVLAAAKEHDGGVFTHAGRMVDGPVLKHAAALVRRTTS